MKIIKKSVSLLLAIVMILSMFTIIPFEFSAARAITITKHHWDSAAGKVVNDPEVITQYTELSKRSSNDLTSGYYVVTSDTKVSGRLNVANGQTVGLYLGDGATLTCDQGIRVEKEGTLDIYAASKTSGKLSIYLNHNSGDTYKPCAAIGSNDGEDAGEITIHGGTLDLRGDYNSTAAIIGGGHKGAPKRITVWDGNISCKKQTYCNGAGIGGGLEGKMSWGGGEGIRIYGGTIRTDTTSGAGIGSGARNEYFSSSLSIYGGDIRTVAVCGAGVGGGAQSYSPQINIYGGKINAVSTGSDLDDSGAGIGSGEDAWVTRPITITGGTIIAIGEYGAGIGAGARRNANTINISGTASVVATSTAGGAGIGGGREGNAGTINIKGKDVHVTAISKSYNSGDRFDEDIQAQIGKTNWYSDGEKYYATGLQLISWFAQLFGKTVSGAGIGGGYQGSGGTINITEKANVNASSGKYAAAIGGADEHSFDTINISDSTVIANAGDYGAGIGSGDESETGGIINITNGADVNATGGTDAAGIGTGNETDASCTINISDSTVTAHGGRYGAGIGGGDDVSGGDITIERSNVTADSATDGAGIGGGESGHGGNITIIDSTVKATGGGYAAGIGGGDDGDGGNIKLQGSTVSAWGGVDGAGIGGGEDGNGGHIEIVDSEVHAYGSEYGSGIGGGEDEGVSYVGISGQSTVEAVAGGDGNSVAIGNGDYNSFLYSRPSCGTLTLSDNLLAKAGSKASSTADHYSQSRYNAVRNNKYALVYACAHANAEWIPLDVMTHQLYCGVCGCTFPESAEEHKWNVDHVCVKCGQNAVMKRMTLIERDVYNDADLPTTIEAPVNTKVVLPDCEQGPVGYEFVCWMEEGADYQNALFPYDVVELAADKTFRALYLPVVTTEYVDEAGERKSVLAKRLDSDHLILGDGWYVVSQSFDAKSTIAVIGDAHLILADGATLKPIPYGRFPIDYSMNKNSSLTIYGQYAQSGTLDLSSCNDSPQLRHFVQYGAIVKGGAADFVTDESVKIVRGTFDVKGATAYGVANLLGGTIKIDDFSAIKSIELGCNTSDSSITLDQINYKKDQYSIDISDGQTLTDGTNLYTGTLTDEQVQTAEGKKLELYDSTHYDLTGWLWSDDHTQATAVFKHQENGDIIKVSAKVRYEDIDKNRVATAQCVFAGKEYSVTETFRLIFDINIAECEHGTVTSSAASAKRGEHIELTTAPDEGCKLTALYYTDQNGAKTVIDDDSFEMPESDITVTAVFSTLHEIEYIDEDGNVQTAQAAELTNGIPELTSGWYYVEKKESNGHNIGQLSITNSIDLNGDVKLILRDGAIMNMNPYELGSSDLKTAGALTVYRAPGETEGIIRGLGVYAGSVDIVGGKIETNVYARSLDVLGGTLKTSYISVEDEANISGGTVNSSGDYGVVFNCLGDIHVTGGSMTVKSRNGSPINCSGELAISGGDTVLTGTMENENTVVTVSGGSLTYNGRLYGKNISIVGGSTTVDGTLSSPNDVILGWSEPTDSITVTSYEGNGKIIFIRDMTDGTYSYSGTYESNDKERFNEKTLTPDKAGTAWAFLQSRINYATNGTAIRLTENVEATDTDTALLIPVGKSITLDLNGFTLDRCMDEATADGNVITNNGTLTIRDSSIDDSGVITGGYHSTAGGGIVNNGTLNIEGGAITGNRAYEGGGIANPSGSALNLYGGSVSSNTAYQFGGAGVLNSGEMTMSGGTISDNTIEDVSYNGGGIWTNGTLTLSGGTITGNMAGTGGNGGGIYYTGGTLNLYGSPVVSNNTASGFDSDLYIKGGRFVTITDRLESGAHIGLRKDALDSSALTSGLSGKGDVKSFFCDHEGYAVGRNADGEAVFKPAHRILIDTIEHGTVTPSDDTACEGDEVTLTVTPDESYIIKAVTVDGENLAPVNDIYSFIMPDSDVTVGAAFSYVAHVERVEPYVDGTGSYVFGTVEHYAIDGRNYAVNEDGSIGSELSSITFSYFDVTFKAPPTNPFSRVYGIVRYTGPIEKLSELVIPASYESNRISFIGGDSQSTSIFNDQATPPFTLVFKGYPEEIGANAFRNANVTKVIGGTTYLNKIGSNAFASSQEGSPLDITFDRSGTITVGNNIFGNRSVTMHLKHSTQFSSTDFGARSITYDFTDAHTYGDPVWNWSKDNTSAAATFTCTDERCKHEETVEATITRGAADGKHVLLATVDFGGRIYTDSKPFDYFAYHSLSLNGDIGVNFYLNLADEELAEGVRVDFVWNGKSESVTFDSESEKDTKTGCYKATCNVCAAEMNDEIAASITIGGASEPIAAETYKVRDYADVILANQDNKFSDKLITLVKTMLNYGASAQEQFAHNTDAPANHDVDYDLISLIDSEIAAILSDVPDKDSMNAALAGKGIEYYGYSLLLKTKTTLRFYFKKNGADTSALSMLDSKGKNVGAVKDYDDVYCYIEVTDIPASKLGENYELRYDDVSLGSYSAFSYVKDVLRNDGGAQPITDTVTALYRYNEAAIAYFNSVA